jgi:hypothetical protein
VRAVAWFGGEGGRMRAGQIQLVCDACGATVTFLGSEAGTVQDCPKCGGFLDVPEFRRLGPPEDPDAARDRERQERLWAESERQTEVARRHQEWAERQLERADQRREQLQDQEVRLQARWAELLERFARDLDRLEQRAAEPHYGLIDLNKNNES